MKNKKGSVLAYSLIVLAMMLGIATSLSISTIIEKKSASSTEFSTQSLQTADSGIQLAIKKINGNLTGSISTVLGSCDASGVIKNNVDAVGGVYDLSFVDKLGAPITNCNERVNKIASIKSVGTYKNTVRAVSVAVEPPVMPCDASTPSGSFCSFNGLTYGTVTGADGKIWLDRNLGAGQLATAYNDVNAYGWLLQWGRKADGHQILSPLSGVSAALSSTDDVSDLADTGGAANDEKFIINGSSEYDWRNPQSPNAANLWDGTKINNPCPTGFHVPTQGEWATIKTVAGISNYNTAFSSSLKLTTAGLRRNANSAIINQGVTGSYWSSNLSGTRAYSLYFDAASANAATNFNGRANGFSVRCMKN